MMFIIRSGGAWPDRADIDVKLSRETPANVADARGKTDFFCVAETDAITALRAAGWNIVELHDGYYEDGTGGGVAIWGQGRYWEIRSDPFTVKQAVGPTGEPEPRAAEGEQVHVRRAIFGA